MIISNCMSLKNAYFNNFEQEPVFVLEYRQQENVVEQVVVAIEKDGNMFVCYRDSKDLTAYVEYLATKFVEDLQKYNTTRFLVVKHLTM